MNEKTMLALIEIYDKKLKELMSPDDYTAWSIETARKIFKIEIDGMAPSEFKDFVRGNLDKIIGGDDNDQM